MTSKWIFSILHRVFSECGKWNYRVPSIHVSNGCVIMVPEQCSVTFCHKSKCVSERNPQQKPGLTCLIFEKAAKSSKNFLPELKFNENRFHND